MSTTATFEFRGHGGFQQQWHIDQVNPTSCVLASICELMTDGTLRPLQGNASMSIDNIVPGDQNVIIRGSVGWGSDILVRVSIFVA
jgi:hypothetical protein